MLKVQKIHLLIWFWGMILPFASVQAGVVDSLEREIAVSNPDTHRVGLQCKLAWELKTQNPEKALSSLHEAEILSQKLAFNPGLARVLLYRGVIFTNQRKWEEAEKSLQQSREKYTALKDQAGIGKCWNKTGILFFTQAKYPEAINCFEKALEYFSQPRPIAMTYNNLALAWKALGKFDQFLQAQLNALAKFEEMEDWESVSAVYGNLGGFYKERHDTEKSLQYFEKAIELNPRIQKPELRISNLVNMGLTQDAAGQPERALESYRLALAMSRENGLRQLEAISLNNLAHILNTQDRIPESISRYEEALALFQELKDPKGEAATLNNLARCHLQEGNPTKGLEYFHLALEVALRTANLAGIETAYQNLSTAYEENGNPAEALLYQKKYIQIHDSLLDEQKLRDLVELETRYELDKKAKMLAQQLEENQKSQRLSRGLIIAVGILILFLLAGLIYLWEQKRTIHRLNTRKSSLERDHFDLAVALAEVTGRLKQLNEIEAERLEKSSDDTVREFKPQTLETPGLPPFFETLSKREIEVFLCLANGLPNKTIADELFISVDTVRSHTKSIYSKLGISNRSMAVKMAHDFGLAS
ncbi:MAG: tetratricopeptide repeat protein [Bacteroidia bacterium]|nr:tetratricopeptide repeat protein [Bacteroidia bacterium]